MSGIHERASFGFVRYGSVWEDADVLCAALGETARGGRVLSIASAGDNALALLTLDPAEEVAADLSLAQLACVALRLEALRRLDDGALLAFLGLAPATDRAITYLKLRGELPAFAREMGIPCVVGVPGLLGALRDGDEVEMDGTTGAIRRLAAGEDA